MQKAPEDNAAEEKAHLFVSIFIPLVFVLLMWLTKLFEKGTGISLVHLGIHPRHLDGIPGIFLSPFIHADYNHLISNSIPFVILGFLLLYNYRKVAFQTFVFIWLFSGIAVWCIGRDAWHIGASSLIYGFIFFLFFSGVFRKNMQSIALSLLIVFLYGQVVWGMFPIDLQLSWEGHLMGACAGSFMAFIYRKVDLPPQIEFPEDEEEDDAEEGWTEDENAEVPFHYHLTTKPGEKDKNAE